MADPQKRVPLGNTGLSVSQLGFGCAPIGNLLSEVPESDALDAIRTAFDEGARFIDMAPFYGYGLAEKRAGEVLRTRRRDDFVVSTKVGRLIRPGKRSGNELFGEGQSFYLANMKMRTVLDYSYDGVFRSLEDSLERLGLDRVDILHIHDPDDHFDEAVKGAYKALDELRSEGSISAVSAGMNQWEMLSRFMDYGRFDCFLLAGRYSLLDQTALPEFLPKCEKNGVSVIAGGVFNSGLLADPREDATFNYVPAPKEMLEKALRIQKVCISHGVEMKAAALQFPLFHPVVVSVLTGVRSPAEWRENQRLMSASIPAALWSDLKKEGLIASDAPVA